MPDNIRVAVIGGGPGGYAAAFLAADLGMNVTLIDPEANPGGVCSTADASLRKLFFMLRSSSKKPSNQRLGVSSLRSRKSTWISCALLRRVWSKN